MGKPVVVDAEHERIYGPFASWADAEAFSDSQSRGQWAVINLESPNFLSVQPVFDEVTEGPLGHCPTYHKRA